MATNPYFTQYHTQRFSFIGSPQQRDGTYQRDQRFLNMYPELIKSPISDGKKYYLKKRPGMTDFLNLPAGNAQGIYYWNGNYFIAVGGFLYTSVGGNTPLITLTNSGSSVGFCEYKDDTQDLLFVCDGNHAWTIQTTFGVTQITDANFPSPHIPTPIFFDGYIFLAAAGSQTIHNSTLQNPYTWPTGGFIDAEMFPDALVALAKTQNYIACIGAMSIEFMYDNANATGSPLQRNAPAVAQFGCPAPGSIVQTERELILVGSTNNGGRTVWIVNGFQPTEIANQPVREALDLEGSGIGDTYGYTIQVAGHKFYVLNLFHGQRTFVYDFDEQMWHEWSTGLAQAIFAYKYAADGAGGKPALLNYTTGQVVFLDPTVYTDLGLPINCTVITTKLDFDTMMRKRIYRLSLVGDAPNFDANVLMYVYWSDDDYNTWSPGAVFYMNAQFPTIKQLGYTRRRAFKFLFQQPYPLRLEAFEVDIIQEVRR